MIQMRFRADPLQFIPELFGFEFVKSQPLIDQDEVVFVWVRQCGDCLLMSSQQLDVGINQHIPPVRMRRGFVVYVFIFIFFESIKLSSSLSELMFFDLFCRFAQRGGIGRGRPDLFDEPKNGFFSLRHFQ